jgi:hypothetical protein
MCGASNELAAAFETTGTPQLAFTQQLSIKFRTTCISIGRKFFFFFFVNGRQILKWT